VYVLTKEEGGGTRRFQGLPAAVYFRTTDVTGLIECRRTRDGDARDNIKMNVELIAPIRWRKAALAIARWAHGGAGVCPRS